MTENLKKTLVYSNENVIGQFLRSVVVGGIASLVDISLFSMGVNLLGINHIAANTFSFVFGLLVNYYLSREWVFNQKIHNARKDFMLFALIGVIGLILSNFLLFIFVDFRILYLLLATPNSRIVKPAAKVIVVAIVFFWNFFARKKFVFSN